MKPPQNEIIINNLLKGVEVSATFQYKDNNDKNVEILGFINCIKKGEKYYCLIRELRSDNQLDYFEEDAFDKNEECIFEKLEDLIEYIKSQTNLSLDNFKKAKNNIYYRY